MTSPACAAVAVGRALGVVAALGPRELCHLVLHRLVQHGEPGPDGEREQALLRSAGDLAQRELHLVGQRPLGDLVGRDDLDGV